MSRVASTERAPRASNGIWLLLLALVAGIGAYALVGLGKHGRVPPSIELYGSLIVAGFVGAWFAVRTVRTSRGSRLASRGRAPVLARIRGDLAAEA